MKKHLVIIFMLIIGSMALGPSPSFAIVFSCLAYSGDNRPQDVFPDTLELDTSIKDTMGGPLNYPKAHIFTHRIGKTIRQTTIYKKNLKAQVTAHAYGKKRWYRCEKVG